MSDQAKQKICSESATGKNLSPNRNKFALIDSEQQLNSIKKFNDSIGYLSNTPELNNNSILSSSAEGSGVALTNKMDSKRKSNDDKPGTAVSSQESKSSQPSVLQIPTYTSIFASNRSASPNSGYQSSLKVGSSGRGPLKKQLASDLELSAASVDQTSGRKHSPISYGNNKDQPQLSSVDDEDENEDDEIDERLPFSANMKKLRSSQNYKRVPLDHRSCPYTGKHSMVALDHNAKQNPQTRISFNDSRPPSFSTCQYGYDHEVYATRKLDWPVDQTFYARCDCDHKVHKKANKSAAGHHENFDRKYNRARSINLMLKTTVLILLTLLLLMLFIGIILASHYLPQVVDRVLSATRSFNVTIAG